MFYITSTWCECCLVLFSRCRTFFLIFWSNCLFSDKNRKVRCVCSCFRLCGHGFNCPLIFDTRMGCCSCISGVTDHMRCNAAKSERVKRRTRGSFLWITGLGIPETVTFEIELMKHFELMKVAVNSASRRFLE